jgi:hypothetical protein
VKKPLAVLNVVGGLAVLGSYVLAFAYSAAVREGLWGGVPDALRPLYTVSMLLAAVGYFPFTWLFVFGRPAYEAAKAPGHDRTMLGIYALVLVPSSLWLPMTAWLIEAPSALLFWAVRLVLFLVAAGALAIVVRTAQHGWRRGTLAGWLPFAGAVPFFFQTGVLDALVWPYFYPAV